MSTIQLHLGDCLDFMRTLDASSADAVITDLPYGTTACAWDSVIPFVPMWEAVKRILKVSGVFVTTASQPFTSLLVTSNLDWFRYAWVWEKSLATGYLNANRNPMKAHEDVVVFSPKGHVFNPQNPTHTPGRATRGAAGDVVRDKSVGGYVTINQGDRFPRSVIKFNSANDTDHPTQKPVALYEYLVRTYTNPGDTVLDFCFGSGTTGVACVRTGRNFIGCDNDPTYFAIAERRIHEAQLQPPLFPHESNGAAHEQLLFDV